MAKPEPVPPSTPAGSTADHELNRGLHARAAKDYRSAEARRAPDRLKPLDAARARELAEAIARGK